MKKFIVFAACALGFGSAFAVPDLAFTGVGKGLHLRWTLDGGDDFTNSFVGELGLHLITSGGTSDFFGYCVDANVRIPDHDPHAVQILDTNSLTPNGAGIAFRVNTFAPTIRSSGTDLQAGALQLAVWELLYETSGTYNVASGHFRAKNTDGSSLNAAVAAQAQNYLAAMGTSVAPYYRSNFGPDKPFSQSFVGPGAVPEPTTLVALIGVGLAGIRRRRK